MTTVVTKLCVAFGAAVALGGCAMVSNVPFNPAENPQIRSVALINIPAPSPAIRNQGSPVTLMGGAVGAAIATSASAAASQDPFQQLLAQQGFDFGREMQQALTSRLQKIGYSVKPIEVQRKETYRLLDDYERLPAAGADAILDSTNAQSFGYSNVTIMDNKFRPHIHLRIRLVDAKTQKVLYGEEILYGYTNTFMKAVQLKAPDKYFYDSEEAILADGRKTVEGLRDGIAKVADYVAGQLSGGQAGAKR